MLRPRPIWIETRVPARLNCPHCKAKDRALLNPNSVENSYDYVCEVCCGRSHFTLAELNDPALTIVSLSPKRITA
jgi:transcription elongation factor Elf1